VRCKDELLCARSQSPSQVDQFAASCKQQLRWIPRRPLGPNTCELPANAGRPRPCGLSASPSLAVLPGELLGDLAHQRPIPGADGVP
jgi:hypothetical protein